MTEQRNSATPIDPVKLDRLAEVAVKVGLGLRPGQDLLLTAPAIALPLVRRIAAHAYKAGAGIVTPILSDEEMTLARYRHGHDNSFDRAANWLYEGMAKAFSDNTARLAIVGDNPMLLSNEDPSKVARASKANSMAYQPALEKIVNFDINWNIIAYPSPSWAKQVFPNDSEDVAISKLADAIFAASRVDREDAMGNWASHNAVLRERTNWLNGKRFRALHYTGPGTNLTIGLADGHEWEGGASLSKNGISCNANIPTEEVFTTPHCRRVEGHVVSSKPLSYQGTLIDNIAVRFEDGRIVDAKASRAVRRERGIPHRARPVLFEVLRQRCPAHAAADRGARRQPESDPYRLDDRFGRDRYRRHPGRRQQGAGVPQGRVGEVTRMIPKSGNRFSD
jgi:aminopeptidase